MNINDKVHDIALYVGALGISTLLAAQSFGQVHKSSVPPANPHITSYAPCPSELKMQEPEYFLDDAKVNGHITYQNRNYMHPTHAQILMTNTKTNETYIMPASINGDFELDVTAGTYNIVVYDDNAKPYNRQLTFNKGDVNKPLIELEWKDGTKPHAPKNLKQKTSHNKKH